LRETVWENWEFVSGALGSVLEAVGTAAEVVFVLAEMRAGVVLRGARPLSSGRCGSTAVSLGGRTLGCNAGSLRIAVALFASLGAAGNDACAVGAASAASREDSVLPERRMSSVDALAAPANSASPPSTAQVRFGLINALGAGTGVERTAHSSAEFEPVPVAAPMGKAEDDGTRGVSKS
jgi:hypothetical protein